MAVLAHAGAVAKGLDLSAWMEAGLGCFEAFYPAHRRAVTKQFTALAARHGILVTAGTDFHGPQSERDRMFEFEYSDETFFPFK